MREIRVDHVSKSFGKAKALDDVSLSFEHGKIHALLGRNGAGKSTLLGLLAPRLAPTRARIFVDDIAQASAVGEIETALKKGVIHPADILGEIGEVLSGQKPGRLSPEDITVFDSTGIALQDLAVAKLAIDLAEQKHPGGTVEL